MCCEILHCQTIMFFPTGGNCLSCFGCLEPSSRTENMHSPLTLSVSIDATSRSGFSFEMIHALAYVAGSGLHAGSK